MMGAFGGSSAGATKTEDFVDFPIEGLDMSKYYLGNEAKEQSMIYDCYAVSNHFGSMGFGHYTAFAKNSSTGKWFEFDDARVTEVPSEHVKRKVVTSAAYNLFFRKRDWHEKNIAEGIDFDKMAIKPTDLSFLEESELKK
jgi:ubiquitin carboxyl-terminal hydrolase 4/11/15